VKRAFGPDLQRVQMLQRTDDCVLNDVRRVAHRADAWRHLAAGPSLEARHIPGEEIVQRLVIAGLRLQQQVDRRFRIVRHH
jgi:hypothetical protein